jgi:hypothetical protein
VLLGKAQKLKLVASVHFRGADRGEHGGEVRRRSGSSLP